MQELATGKFHSRPSAACDPTGTGISRLIGFLEWRKCNIAYWHLSDIVVSPSDFRFLAKNELGYRSGVAEGRREASA
jgi:hypothetical protein